MSGIPDSVTKGNPNDKLVIVGFPCFHGTTSSGSPFVSKVETFCRLAGIPYEVKLAGMSDRSPKGTVPFIKHGDVVLADSEFILDYLTNTYDVKVKPSDDPRLRGTAVAVKRLCEHHLVFGGMYYRMTTPQGWQLVYETFFEKIPIPMKWIAAKAVRKNAFQTLHKQGFGRHSEPDVRKLVNASLQAVSDILGENKYITGDTPCPDDASLFAFLDTQLKPEIESVPSSDLVKQYPNLVAYVENMKAELFPADNPSKFEV